jgi:hypothetical protein
MEKRPVEIQRGILYFVPSSLHLSLSYLYLLPSFLPSSFTIPFNLLQWKISYVFVTHTRRSSKSYLMVAAQQNRRDIYKSRVTLFQRFHPEVRTHLKISCEHEQRSKQIKISCEREQRSKQIKISCEREQRSKQIKYLVSANKDPSK